MDNLKMKQLRMQEEKARKTAAALQADLDIANRHLKGIRVQIAKEQFEEGTMITFPMKSCVLTTKVVAVDDNGTVWIEDGNTGIGIEDHQHIRILPDGTGRQPQ